MKRSMLRPTSARPPASPPPPARAQGPDEQWRWRLAQDVWVAHEAHRVSRAGGAVVFVVSFMVVVLVLMYGYVGLLWLREIFGF